MNRFITKPVIALVLFFILFSQPANSQSVISGHIFSDANNDGIYDANEGLNSVTVWLMDNAAVSPFYQVYPVQTAITSVDGNYNFSNVGNGSYQIRVKISSLEKPSAGLYDSVLTREIADNNPYNVDNNPNGATVINISVSGTYNNIDFGFKPNLATPTNPPTNRFSFNSSTNSFMNETSQGFNLAPMNCGGVVYNPTITFTTDRQCALGSQVYPQAGDNSNPDGADWPGANKGGFYSNDTTLQLAFGKSCYNPANNDKVTLTIDFSKPVTDVRFTIYDIDCINPQLIDGSIDHVKVTGYNGANPVMPVIVLPQAAPFNSVSGNTISGWADYPDNNSVNNYPDLYNSGNSDNGNADIYFTSTIDKIVIEYEEIAPVSISSVKKIKATVSPINDESQWATPVTPTPREISIGSIGYTYYCNVLILAADVMSFDAMASGQKVNLQWNKKSEQDIKQYRIERLSSTGNWMSLGTVAAVGAGHVYHFTDLNPIKGVNQYRLVLISNDGGYHLSEVRKVSIAATTDIEIINNLAPTLNMVVHGQAKDIAVFDASGKRIYDYPVKNTSNGTTTISLDHFALHTGFYFVKALFANGEVKTLKFVKN